jgi:carboxylate-amine ligase
MRELARREPTFGLHVHVGASSPATAIELYNRLRGHLPLLLALSGNSPLWQGRDTGLASMRTPIFQLFPRVGIPRPFRSYSDWVEAVDVLLRSDAFGDPTFLWWDVRPQPRLGTVEVRIPDVQSASSELLAMPEVLHENRFIAARDGMEAHLIDPVLERQVPARAQLEELLTACLPHARELSCERELSWLTTLAERTGARRQLEIRRTTQCLADVVAALADLFVGQPPPDADARFDHLWPPAGDLPPHVHLLDGALVTAPTSRPGRAATGGRRPTPRSRWARPPSRRAPRE